MVAVVYGYVCFTSCDVAAARAGKDPNAPPGSPPGTKAEKKSPFDTQPATILDGVLKNSAQKNAGSASGVNASSATFSPDTPPKPSVNLLA